MSVGEWLARVNIYGEIQYVTINGVDIGLLVGAELNRRDPLRAKRSGSTACHAR